MRLSIILQKKFEKSRLRMRSKKYLEKKDKKNAEKKCVYGNIKTCGSEEWIVPGYALEPFSLFTTHKKICFCMFILTRLRRPRECQKSFENCFFYQSNIFSSMASSHILSRSSVLSLDTWSIKYHHHHNALFGIKSSYNVNKKLPQVPHNRI